MKHVKYYIALLPVIALSLTGLRCTKLDSKVYSQVVNDNFWQTPAQIAAGKSPAYAALQGLGGNSGIYWENEISSDEMITPTRGDDWGDADPSRSGIEDDRGGLPHRVRDCRLVQRAEIQLG